jgi:hypothetical protein
MSIGNLKDTGNQGNNMPWQWKMLQGLQSIIGNNTTNFQDLLNLLQPQSRSANIIRTTTSGSTPTNTYSLTITNVGASGGLVEGEVLPPNISVSFEAGVLNNVLNPVSYDATGTIFLITFVGA